MRPRDKSPLPTTNERAQAGVAWGWLVGLCGFVAYAAFLAPPEDPALTHALVVGAFSGKFGTVDPSIAAVFSVLGVVPAITAAFVLRDGASRKLPAWPFALAMFAVGAFALLPWLALRGVGGPRAVRRAPGLVRRALAHPTTGWALMAALLALGGWAIVAGSLTAYVRAFHAAAMVNVMTIDLCVCSGLLMVLVEEARAHGCREPAAALWARRVPLLGSAAWNALVRRDP